MKNDVIFVQIIGLVFLSGLGLGEPSSLCEERKRLGMLGCPNPKPDKMYKFTKITSFFIYRALIILEYIFLSKGVFLRVYFFKFH